MGSRRLSLYKNLLSIPTQIFHYLILLLRFGDKSNLWEPSTKVHHANHIFKPQIGRLLLSYVLMQKLPPYLYCFNFLHYSVGHGFNKPLNDEGFNFDIKYLKNILGTS